MTATKSTVVLAEKLRNLNIALSEVDDALNQVFKDPDIRTLMEDVNDVTGMSLGHFIQGDMDNFVTEKLRRLKAVAFVREHEELMGKGTWRELRKDVRGGGIDYLRGMRIHVPALSLQEAVDVVKAIELGEFA